MLQADASKVSKRAKKRGIPQLGTLGAGNHYCEIQVRKKIIWISWFYFWISLFCSILFCFILFYYCEIQVRKINILLLFFFILFCVVLFLYDIIPFNMVVIIVKYWWEFYLFYIVLNLTWYNLVWFRLL